VRARSRCEVIRDVILSDDGNIAATETVLRGISGRLGGAEVGVIGLGCGVSKLSMAGACEPAV